MNPPAPTTTQANIEYFYRLLYECLHGGCYSDPGVVAFLSKLWIWIIYVGYALSVIALIVILYTLVQLFELRKREEEFYGTIILAPDAESGGHPRWDHIQDLIAGNNPSQWREAIIESDIMLDEMLTRAGYSGETVSEKLKGADKLNFSSLQDAWEAHKVRNQIAHEGSSFELTEQLARRTVARYENVFREFKIVQ